MKKKTVIIVSPHFPPNSLASVHRVRHLAKHLPHYGWRPIVVRVRDEFYTEQLDPVLAALLPKELEEVRTRALNTKLARLIGIGDIGLRAFFSIAAAIDRLVINENPEAVLITGAPFYPMLLSRRIQRRYCIPVVLDFQDPWVSAFGATQPRWSKAGIAHLLGVALEPVALKNASFITSVSDIQNDEMRARHPWLDAASMAAIPIGGDPEDYSSLNKGDTHNDGTVTLRYIGAFWPRAEDNFRLFFRGVAAFRKANPSLSRRLRLEFVGTYSGVPREDVPRPIARIANEEGVGSLVVERPQRVPFTEALSLMACADRLLLIGSDEPHYTASKIFPALMSGRPFLSLYHAHSSAHAILAKAGGGYSISYDPRARDGLVSQIVEGLEALIERPEILGRADPSIVQPYSANAIAGQFAQIFDGVARRGVD